MLLTALSLTAASGGFREGEKAQRSKSQRMVIYESIGNFYKCFRLKKFLLRFWAPQEKLSLVRVQLGEPKKKDTLLSESFLFSEINLFLDLWNTLRAWNIASQCEMPVGREWIYFISLDALASNFTIYIVNYFAFVARQIFLKIQLFIFYISLHKDSFGFNWFIFVLLIRTCPRGCVLFLFSKKYKIPAYQLMLLTALSLTSDFS